MSANMSLGFDATEKKCLLQPSQSGLYLIDIMSNEFSTSFSSKNLRIFFIDQTIKFQSFKLSKNVA